MGRRKHWRNADDTDGEILSAATDVFRRAFFRLTRIEARRRKLKDSPEGHGKVAMFSFSCTDVTP